MPNGHRSKLKNRGKLYFIQEKHTFGHRHTVLSGTGDFSKSNFLQLMPMKSFQKDGLKLQNEIICSTIYGLSNHKNTIYH